MSKLQTSVIFGKKLGMTTLFDENGQRVNVTVLEAGPCTVVAKRTKEANGYEAIQVGFGEIASYKKNQPELGHFKKAGVEPTRHLREIRLNEGEVDGYELGQAIKADLFAAGDRVDISGTSKGKGFQGVMKRYNFGGFRATHGTAEYFRHGGGISACEFPGKVWKNKKMPGQMGNKKVTTQNLTIFQVRPEENLILVRGAVPGPINGMIRLQKSRKQAIREAAKQAA